MELWVVGLSAIAGLALGPSAAPAVAQSEGADGCIYQLLSTTTANRYVGFKGTDVVSYQLAGPGTISYSVSTSADQTFGTSGSATFDVSAIVAKASATWGVSYSRSIGKSSTWTYTTSIPAGKTGVGALLHSDDKIDYTQKARVENCTTQTVSGKGYLPLTDIANTRFCFIRDLYPYSYSEWRSGCTGE